MSRDGLDLDSVEPSWMEDGLGVQGLLVSSAQEDLTEWPTEIEIYDVRDEGVTNC